MIIKVTSIGILLNIFFSYFFIRLGWGIEGVALGTVGSRMIMGFIYLSFTLNHFFHSFKDKFFTVMDLLLPFIVIATTIIFIEMLIPGYGILKKEIHIIIIKLLGVLIAWLPFFFKLKGKVSILSIMSHG